MYQGHYAQEVAAPDFLDITLGAAAAEPGETARESASACVVLDVSDSVYLYLSDYTLCTISRSIVDEVVRLETDYKYGDILYMTGAEIALNDPVSISGKPEKITYAGNVADAPDICRKDLTVTKRIEGTAESFSEWYRWLYLVDEDGTEYQYSYVCYPYFVESGEWKMSMDMDEFDVGDVIEFAIDEQGFGLFPIRAVEVPAAEKEVNVTDVISLQKYLLGYRQMRQAEWKRMDQNGDGYIDVFDLALLKRRLLEKRS